MPPLISTNKRLKRGLFSDFETPDQRLRRLRLLGQSDKRRQIENVRQVTLPAINAATLRRQRQQQLDYRTAVEASRADPLSRLNTTFFDKLKAAQEQRERDERRRQELDIISAQRQLSEVERRQAPLTLAEAGSVLKNESIDQVRRQFREVTRRPAVPGARPHVEIINAAGLDDEQRTAVLREVSRRGDENVTTGEVYSFISEARKGTLGKPLPKKPVSAIAALRGKPEVQYVKPIPLADKPTFTPVAEELETVRFDRRDVSLSLPLNTARGRTLADWKRQYAAQAPHLKTDARAAVAFDELTGKVRDEIKKSLIEQGLDEDKVELYASGFVEMEFRRAELFEQGKREWQRQTGKSVPDEATQEKIDEQVNEAIAVEFEDLIKLSTYEPPGILGRAKTLAKNAGPIAGPLLTGGVTTLELASLAIRPPLLAATTISGFTPATIALEEAGVPVPGIVQALQGRKSILDPLRSRSERRLRGQLMESLNVKGAPVGRTGALTMLQDLMTVGEGGFTSILPEPAIELIEKAPFVGPSLRREVEFATGPAGIAMLTIGGPVWARFFAVGGVGGVAAGGFARGGVQAGVLPERLPGVGIETELAAQLLGNIATPGAGLVPLKAPLRGPLRPIREMIDLFYPGEALKQVKLGRASPLEPLVVELADDVRAGAVDPAVIAHATGGANMLQTATLGLQMRASAARVREIMRAITLVAREGPGALRQIKKSVHTHPLFRGMLVNLGSEAGGVELRGGGQFVDVVGREGSAQLNMAKRLVQVTTKDPESEMLTRAELEDLAGALGNVEDTPARLLDDLIGELRAEFGEDVVRVTTGGRYAVRTGLEDELTEFVRGLRNRVTRVTFEEPRLAGPVETAVEQVGELPPGVTIELGAGATKVEREANAAIEYAFTTYGQGLRRFIVSSVKDDDVADDILSEVFEAAIVRSRKAGFSATELDNFKSYLFSTAKSRVLDHFKRLGWQQRRLQRLAESMQVTGTRITGPEQAVIQREELELAGRLIKDLSELDRRMLGLDVRGATQTTISRELKVPRTTVGFRLKKIHTALRDAFVEERVAVGRPAPSPAALEERAIAPGVRGPVVSEVENPIERFLGHMKSGKFKRILAQGLDAEELQFIVGRAHRDVAGLLVKSRTEGNFTRNLRSWLRDNKLRLRVGTRRDVKVLARDLWTTRDTIGEFGPTTFGRPTRDAGIAGAIDQADDVEDMIIRLGGEEGGTRITNDTARLTPDAERILSQADEGAKLTRSEVLRAAAREGIPGRRVNMSNAAIVAELRAARGLLDSLVELRRTVLRTGPALTNKQRAGVERVIARGRKATLGELRRVADDVGVQAPKVKPLTAAGLGELSRLEERGARGALSAAEETRLVELQSRASTVAADVTERQTLLNRLAELLRPVTADVGEEVITDVRPAEAGVPFGSLSSVSQRAVYNVMEDMAAGRPITNIAERQLQAIIEAELQRLGVTAEDALRTGKWRTLGRDPSALSLTGRRAIAEVDDATRALLASENPIMRLQAVASEYENLGKGAGGVGREPPPSSGGPPAGRAGGPPFGEGGKPPNRFTLIKSLEHFVGAFEDSMKNMVGAATRVAGRAGMESILKYVNPTPFYEGRVGLAMGGFMNKLQMWGQYATTIEQRLRKMEVSTLPLGRPLIRWRDNVARDLVSKTGKVVTPEHLIEDPDDILRVTAGGKILGPLKDEQRAFVDEVRAVLDDLRAFEDQMGIELENIADGPMGRYFPRNVIEAKSLAEKEALIRSRGRSLNRTFGFQKDREYETMWDGMLNGVKYGDGVTENVGARMRAGLAATLDKEVKDFLTDAGQEALFNKMIDDAKQTIKFPVVGAVESLNNLARPLVTNIDLGFLGLQMVPAFARNPVAAIKGTLYALDSLVLNGKLYAGYVRHNTEDGWIPRYFNAGGAWGQSEFTFGFAAKQQTLPRALAKLLHKGPFRRFDGAFSNSLNVASLETFKGIVGVNDALYRLLGNRRASQLITRAFAGFAPIEGKTADQQAASIASKLTLRMNRAALQLPLHQGQFERIMLFAPGYYRAAFSLLGDAIQGGMRGAEARRSLGQLVIGFMGLNSSLEMITGSSLELDPNDPHFLQMRVGGLWVGPGGPLVSLLKLIGRATREDREGEFLVDLPFGLGLNPGLAKFDINENPIMRWGRGKLSPIASLITDEVSKQTFMYDKLDSVEDHLINASRRITPFFIQSGIEAFTAEGSWKNAGAGATLEFFTGATTFPISAFDKRADVEREIADERYPDTWDPSKPNNGLDQAQMNKIKEDPRWIAANEEVKERQRDQESQVRQALDAKEIILTEFKDKGTINNEPAQATTQAEDNRLFDVTKEIDGQQWITRYKERQTKTFAYADGAQAMAEQLGFLKPFEEDEKERKGPVDLAVNAYFEVIPANYELPDGDTDWQAYFNEKDLKFNAALRAGESANGPQGRSDVTNLLRPFEEDPTVRTFKKAADVFRQLKEMPKYRGVSKEEEVQVDNLLDRITLINRTIKDAGGRSTKTSLLKGFLRAMSPNDPMFRVVAVALLRSSAKTKEAMWNPARDELVFNNPFAVKFYVSLYRNMNDMNKIRFLEQFGVQYFSNDFIEQEGINPTLPAQSILR